MKNYELDPAVNEADLVGGQGDCLDPEDIRILKVGAVATSPSPPSFAENEGLEGEPHIIVGQE